MPGVESQINGKKGGRPRGSTTKPQIGDYLSKKGATKLMDKAYEMAEGGDGNILKFVLEQYFGRARQAMELTGSEGKAIEVQNTLSPEANKKLSDGITKLMLEVTKE